MKTCFKCHETKPLADFYRHKMMADGYLNKCKVCARADSTRHRWRNLERIREYDRHRGRKGNQSEARLRALKTYASRNPEKYKAHYAVHNAIRDGRLTRQPCEVCGSSRVDAHHDDYSKPLNVMWLCRKHHAERHMELRQDEESK